jgi:hypothetical protein
LGVADAVPLIDQHCHGVATVDVDVREWLSEAKSARRHPFRSLLGLSVRRWCAPVLGLAPHAGGDAYLARRRELGAAEVNRRLLRAAEIDAFLVDSGYRAEEVLSPDEMATASGAQVREIVRLETVAEELLGVSAAGFASAYAEALVRATTRAVGVKSVVASRTAEPAGGGWRGRHMVAQRAYAGGRPDSAPSLDLGGRGPRTAGAVPHRLR